MYILNNINNNMTYVGYVVQFQDVFNVVISVKFSSKFNPTAELWFAIFQSEKSVFQNWIFTLNWLYNYSSSLRGKSLPWNVWSLKYFEKWRSIFNKASAKFTVPLNRSAVCKKQTEFIQSLFHPTSVDELGLDSCNYFLLRYLLLRYPAST